MKVCYLFQCKIENVLHDINVTLNPDTTARVKKSIFLSDLFDNCLILENSDVLPSIANFQIFTVVNYAINFI